MIKLLHKRAIPADLPAVRQWVWDYIHQDNRGTAHPIAYVVQEKVQVFVPSGCGDERYYDVPQLDGACTKAEIEEWNEGCEDPKDLINIDKLKSPGDSADEWVDRAWFFTETAALKHVRLNGHNYPRGYRLYVRHQFRNEEAGLIIQTMFALAGVDYQRRDTWESYKLPQ